MKREQNWNLFIQQNIEITGTPFFIHSREIQTGDNCVIHAKREDAGQY